MSESSKREDESVLCPCETTSTPDTLMSPHCDCPRNEIDIVVHDETCLMWKNEKFLVPRDDACECTSLVFEDGHCQCCGCPPDQCRCMRAGREVFDEWRSSRPMGALPAVLESTHPLMQKFQENLRQFLQKENDLAEEEIMKLRDELKLSKQGYERDYEEIYRSDHDTNSQRVLIEEYESSLAQRTAERQAAEVRAREANDKYKQTRDKLEKEQFNGKSIYRSDHDTNSQRVLIEEYESSLAQRTAERQAAEVRAREANDKYKQTRDKLEKEQFNGKSIYRSDHDTNSQRVLIEEYESSLAQRTAERQAAEVRAREANDKYKQTRDKLEKEQFNGKSIYRSDHDTNSQRVLIEEYESSLAQRTAERQAAEVRAREANDKYKQTRDKLEKEQFNGKSIYRSDHDTNRQRVLIEEYENSLAQRTAERQAAEVRAREANDKYKQTRDKLEKEQFNGKSIYRSDHDTNSQRVLIEEYESSLAQRTAERQAAEVRAREANDKYKQTRDKLEKEQFNGKSIYRSDHDTNSQRVLIEEYESSLAQRTAERQAAEVRAREANDKYKQTRDKLEKEQFNGKSIYRSDHDTNSQRVLIEEYESSLAQRTAERQAAEVRAREANDKYKQTRDKLEKEQFNGKSIYRSDHDTNSQRVLIEEYESSLAQRTAERQAAEVRAREANDKYKQTRDKLEKEQFNEREATEELEALTTLCRQLEKWREETESDLTVSQRVSDKMRQEKRALAQEKRELDMILFSVGQEVWKLESKLAMFQKQLEIKNVEMENINDKVTTYAAELEDLDLDKRRLVSLWNSVLVNIQQRDKVYDSVKEDYRLLQENYRTLINNLEVTKKAVVDEMNQGKEIAMNKDKIIYDIEHATKQFRSQDEKRVHLEAQIAQYTESIELTERDEQMMQMENQAMRNILKNTEKECDLKGEMKLKLENDILVNLQDCLLNDKAVESMANGIKKMREMSRKQEIALMAMENQHAKLMLDIEINRNQQAKNNITLEKAQAKVKEREKEVEMLQEKYDQKALVVLRKQRELDIIVKKYQALKDIFDLKSPQERRIAELENQIRSLRSRTEGMQQEWLRLQGHVVKLADQHQKTLFDINLINKQIQICEQKTMRIQAECETVLQEKYQVDRKLRELRGKLEVLERTRKDALERNDCAQKTNVAMTHEFTANLKGAETEILELEEEIEQFDKDKVNLTQELDRIQREALIWQRKGILAVELKKNMKEAKSSAGEIGQMRTEIHRMEVRREQLRRTSEKLSEDLAQYVTRRETALDKTRAVAAHERAHPGAATSQSNYHHKLRLAKADVARVTKELTDSEARLKQLQEEQARLENEVASAGALNAQLEEQVATLIRECRETDKQKQWLLERVVRSQRLGNELSTAIKKQSVRVKKPKSTVLSEYEQARALNDRLKYIVECLTKEYPHYGDKLDAIANTLNIFTPGNSPRLTQDRQCALLVDQIPEKDGSAQEATE